MRGRGWCRRFLGTGFRWTQSREWVLDIFRKSEGHLTAEDVFFRVKNVYPGIGMATVYRTLELLYQQGLLNRFQFGDGKARYEWIGEGSKKGHHHHLICTSCGRIIDYTDFIERERKLIKDLETALSEKHNFDIVSHQVHFYGLCEKCSKLRNSPELRVK